MILSIGEVVWDIFGEKSMLGGAPVNVAYHLHSLGMDVRIITRIGSDALGKITLQKLKALGLPVDGIQKDEKYATGQVIVSLDASNEPHFDIVHPAAWDFIDSIEARRLAGEKPFYLIYGTLAQRHDASRAAIRTLWEQAAVCFYDVNLRPPFTTQRLVMESLVAADVVKLNGNEIIELSDWLNMAGEDKVKIADGLLERYNLQVVVVTEGKDGAWLVSPEGFYEHGGFPVTISDTIGAGDAFFAAFIEGYVEKRPWPDCLAQANHRGAYVASQTGATPPMALYKF